jgi:ring-1,2-phenylacetyl-CoA epoxidase subunit PaaD
MVGTASRERAWEVAASVPDPELPTLTIEDLGILRNVDFTPSGVPPEGGLVVVAISPTYSGCPAMYEIAADVTARLNRAGFANVTVQTQLSPPWTTDWITPAGRCKLAAAGIAPPSASGPVPVPLGRRPPSPACPRCGSTETTLTAQFSSTACKSLHRCDACGEPFEAVKPL